jgi:putative SOS response-associated peptidase YedK
VIFRQQCPFWAKDASIGFKTINAMSETAAEKPAFRDAMRQRRCLIPADGFYEWEKLDAKQKQPYAFGMANDSVFAFAGLWERWRDPAGEFVETCTILTTKPNALVSVVHDRMPAIVKPGDYEFWLGATPAEAVRFNSWRICSRIARATSVAVGMPVLLWVTSR